MSILRKFGKDFEREGDLIEVVISYFLFYGKYVLNFDCMLDVFR